MTIPAAQDASLGFAPGDHVCAFYSSRQNVLDDIVVNDIRKGLRAGNKVFCMVDQPVAVHGSFRAIVPDLPHFFFCLYDLDLFDGDTVMCVLRTHPRVYVNGIIIGNPHYQANRLPG